MTFGHAIFWSYGATKNCSCVIGVDLFPSDVVGWSSASGLPSGPDGVEMWMLAYHASLDESTAERVVAQVQWWFLPLGVLDPALLLSTDESVLTDLCLLILLFT